MRYTIIILMMLLPWPALSHEMRPAFLEITEKQPGVYNILWETPMRGDLRLSLSPEFSGSVEEITPVITRHTGDAAVQTWRIKTSGSLRGQMLSIDGLDGTMTDVLVRAQFGDETSWTHRFTPSQLATQIPVQESATMVAGVYLKLGVEHILIGIDHLLFVLALLLITSGTWKLVKTITAFTVAHSITLGLATLGFVHVPSPPVEAIIALSIVFLAAEIVRANRGLDSVTLRSPWLIAFIFGLVHGFGFAGALNEIGLPQGQIPLALLFFNVGVELGQLLFIAEVFSFLAVLRRIRVPQTQFAGLVAPYAIGSVAMFWVIQRAAGF